MKIIGITGGIATGKSSLCQWVKNNTKFPVLDADKISHEILASNAFVKEKLKNLFGVIIFTDKSCTQIDRNVLGKIVFADNKKKKLLEKIIHPMVKRKLLLHALWYFFIGTDGVVIEVPLLFEANLQLFFSEVVVATCSSEIQIKRLLHRRPDYSREKSLQLINSQIPLSQKEKLADWVLESGSEKPFSTLEEHARLESLFKQVLVPSKISTVFWLILVYYLIYLFCSKVAYLCLLGFSYLPLRNSCLETFLNLKHFFRSL